MSRNLLIVESPAKCQKIRSFLGPDWTVLATMGHLRALEDSLEAIGLTTGFTKPPTYHWLKEKAKAIQQLKTAYEKGQTRVYLASDDDREGEMIAYSVCVLLHLPPETTPRIVFHEITESAIRHALDHPRTLHMNRVHAQQARAVMDLFIGYTISPLLWKHVAPTLSAGRCQTPALRLVIERETAIETFVSSRSWFITATWSSPPQGPILHTMMKDELEDEDSVQQVLEHAHHHSHGTLIQKDIRPWSESAPDPLMTSTLQQQASQLFHCSPKQTMSIAQRLYEAGHITYMRTDKAVMAEEAKEQARAWVREHLGEKYVAPPLEPSVPSGQAKKMRRPKVCSSSSPPKPQQAQEAHEAIRPTHLDVTELPATEWGPAERRLYQLISRRALQSIMSPAHGERCTLTLLLDDLEDFPWISTDTRTLFEGWKALGQVASMDKDSEEKEDDEEKENSKKKEISWDDWTVGTRVSWLSMKGMEKETTSQGRFTEASLVRELEKHGIGRPSTFASLLSVLQDKGYTLLKDIPATSISLRSHELLPKQWPPTTQTTVSLRGGEKRKLVPTPLGRSVWEWLSHHMEDLFAYTFTASMERQLDEIAEGKGEERVLLQNVWESYKERYESLLSSSSSSASSSSSSSSSPSSSSSSSSASSTALVPSLTQKVFKNGIKAVQTKKGALLLREGATKEDTVFFGWPPSVSWEKITEQKAKEHIAIVTEEREGLVMTLYQDRPVVKKKGQYGFYLRWDAITLPFVEGESVEALHARLEQRTSSASSSSASSPPSSPSAPQGLIKETSQYLIRSGPYGPYMMKKTTTAASSTSAGKSKKTIFVSVPKGLDVAPLTDKEIDALYKAGLEAKKAGLEAKKNRPSRASVKENQDEE